VPRRRHDRLLSRTSNEHAPSQLVADGAWTDRASSQREAVLLENPDGRGEVGVGLSHDALDLGVTERPFDQCAHQLGAVSALLVWGQKRIADLSAAARVRPAREAGVADQTPRSSGPALEDVPRVPADAFGIAGNRIGEPAQRTGVVERRRPPDRRAGPEASPPVRLASGLRLSGLGIGRDEIQARRCQSHHAL